MTNLITKPLVKTTHPELYAKHTYHMSKAYKLTYNYSVVDDYILQKFIDHFINIRHFRQKYVTFRSVNLPLLGIEKFGL